LTARTQLPERFSDTDAPTSGFVDDAPTAHRRSTRSRRAHRGARFGRTSSVDGKIVLITGGASGVGAELARRLHARGAKVVLTDLDAGALSEITTELGPERVMSAVADVADLAAMQAVADKAIGRFGAIDIVVANAGIASYGSVMQVDPAAFARVLDVNVLGVFHTVRAALPQVINRRGYVLIVSSLAAYTALPGLAPYHASKAAVEHFANALRLEVGHLGVDVGSAHMSWIDTALVRNGKADVPTFSEMLSKLPAPLCHITSVQKCGETLAAGIEGRRIRINCPAWTGLFRWLRPALSTPLAERRMSHFSRDLLPRMDAEIAARDRTTSSRAGAIARGRTSDRDPETLNNQQGSTC
jgi:NAD(P)-dependent dehydrogenase (short-subunit alcohol dehydrogenase family)